MATFGALETSTYEAAADLSAKQYHAVRGAGAGLCNMASLSTDSDLLGVLQNKPQSGEFAAVADGGETKVVAGAAITVYDYLSVNGSGRAITVTSGAMAFGQAIEAAGADGDIITARLMKPIRWSGAP